jgi:hypothetical protein
MAKKIISIAIVLMLFATLGAFAYERKSKDIPMLATFDQPGHLNITVTGGYSWSYGASVGAELALGEFDVGPFPMAWGIEGRGVIGFDIYGIDFAAAGLAKFHSGFDLGSNLKFEYYVGLGAGAFMSLGYGGLGIGIAQSAGVVWMFSDTLGLAIDNVDFWSIFGNPWWSYYYYAGVGVLLKL